MLLLLLLLSYTAFIGFLFRGFSKSNQPEKEGSRSLVTVIVPFRNEANTLGKTIPVFLARLGPWDELILVDDHSSDGSYEIASEFEDVRIKLLNSEGQGKKAALAMGVSNAHHTIILTADADVYPQEDWLDVMLRPFLDEAVHMVCGSVHVRTDGSFRSELERIDVLSLVGSAHAFTNFGWMVMCNGANLAFRKSTFNEVGGYQVGGKYITGDDVFLMHRIAEQCTTRAVVMAGLKRRGGVETPAQPSITSLWNQRVRWASKASGYQSGAAKFVAFFVFGSASAVPALLGLSYWMPSFLFFALAYWFGKALLDILILRHFSQEYKQPVKLIPLIFISLMQPFYTAAIGLASQFTSYTWKGRQFSA